MTQPDRSITKTILKHCRLIPELSASQQSEHADIVIEDGKISAIITTGGLTLQDNALDPNIEYIDCQGKTLLPGLFDLHTHISGMYGTSSIDMKSPMGLLVKCCKQIQGYLNYGFTTIRDAGSLDRVANYVRDMIDSNLIVGPRMISCGKILTPTELDEANTYHELYQEADGTDEIRKAVRKEIAEHADFIKLMASGAATHPKGNPTQPIITTEELRAAVEAAAMKGTYVAAHAHSAKAIKMCIEHGVGTIEHASYLDEEAIRMILEQENVYLVPTLAALYHEDDGTNAYLVKKPKEMTSVTTANIEKAYRSGLKLGFGTDCTVGLAAYEHGMEFSFRKEYCHMDNVDILLQATKHSAEIAGLSNVTGEIKAGLAADLILVDGNPDEDISVMYHKPAMVIARGMLVR